ncbi:putative quinol monooxygenase [Pseudomonas akapageensis]|uniref:putative quinol monooxygenase n=1 Tax=Pseudomonas akapageensis TaxID=2609961 RepID=UPI001409DAB4|nr:putative quinol monooxygenase [Pseudomonas akapageensis]
MNTRLYVMTSFAVQPAGLEEMRGLLAQLSEQSRQEPGCLEYGYYQSLTNPLEFSSFEAWQGPEFEAQHWQTPHLQQALARAAGLFDGEPKVVRYQRLT